MNKDLIDAAQEAGLLYSDYDPDCDCRDCRVIESILKFDRIRRRQERERCAKVCDMRYLDFLEPEMKGIAAAIRAMEDE